MVQAQSIMCAAALAVLQGFERSLSGTICIVFDSVALLADKVFENYLAIM